MSDSMSFDQIPEKKIPSNLNVLTILTFIGSGIALIFSLATPAMMKFSKSMIDKTTSSGQELTAKQLTDIEKSRNAIALAEANMVPLMVVGVLSIIACIIGAIWMRKLKKEGFYIYVAGELLPLIVGFILMGTAQFTGIFSVVMGIGIPVVFVILYAVNFKYLK